MHIYYFLNTGEWKLVEKNTPEPKRDHTRIHTLNFYLGMILTGTEQGYTFQIISKNKKTVI